MRSSWLPWALSVASFVATLISNGRALAIGDDGVGYEAIANGIAGGQDHLGYFIEPRLTVWPPLWPGLMAAVSRLTGVSTQTSAVLLNAVCAALLTLGAWRFMTRCLQIERESSEDFAILARIAVTAVAALGGSTMLFSHLLMTDLALATVTTWAWVLLVEFVLGGRWRYFAGAALLATAAFFTRYAGFTVVVICGAWLFVALRTTLVRRLVTTIAFGVASLALPAFWMVRNREIDGTLLGMRYASNRGVFANAYDMASALGNFLLPGIEIDRRPLWISVGVIGTALVAWMAWSAMGGASHRLSSSLSKPIGLAVFQVVGFGSYILYVRSTTALNRLDVRLLNPLYLGLISIGAYVTVQVVRHGDGVASRVGRVALGSWAVGNVVLGLVMVGYFASGAEVFKGNYNSHRYDVVQTSTALKALPADCFFHSSATVGGEVVAVLPTSPTCSVYSNLPNALYEVGLQASWSPRVTGAESDEPVDDLKVIGTRVETEQSYLVWLDEQPVWGHLASLEQLRQAFDLVPLSHGERVDVYQMKPRASDR